MLHVGVVGGDDASDFSWASEDGGVGGTVAEDLGGPVQEAVAIFEELRQRSDQWVQFEACGWSWFEVYDEEDEETEERDEEEDLERQEFHG